MEKLDIYIRLRVLSTLDDHEFEIASTAESELKMICEGTFKPGNQKQFNHLTNYLYMTRCEYFFDNSLLKYQEGIHWKEFYERLTYLYDNINNPFIPNNMASNGKLMELKILATINKFPNEKGANMAAQYGHLNILKWMKENSLPLPNQQGANWAARNGRLNVLEWLASQNPPILPN